MLVLFPPPPVFLSWLHTVTATFFGLQVCSYVNGILYSLLSVPELRSEGRTLVCCDGKGEGS